MKNIINESDLYIISDYNNNNVIQTFIHKIDNLKSQKKAEKIAIIRAEISAFLHEYIHKFKIPTYFLEKISQNQINVLKTQNIPIRIHIYNFVNEFFSKYFSLMGNPLFFPITETYYITEDGDKIFVNETHIAGLNILPLEEFRELNRLAMRLNAILKPLFERRYLVLSEIEVQFGKYGENYLISNELSPINFKVWNKTSANKIEFDYFNFSGDNIYEQYNEFKSRLLLKGD